MAATKRLFRVAVIGKTNKTAVLPISNSKEHSGYIDGMAWVRWSYLPKIYDYGPAFKVKGRTVLFPADDFQVLPLSMYLSSKALATIRECQLDNIGIQPFSK